MLERYIEKNILRQVYLCEQLFEKQAIDIDEVAEQLTVCSVTINHDIENVIGLLQYCISDYAKSKNTCSVHFKAGISLMELTQFIYAQSYFLKFLCYHLEGKTNYTELAEEEFISISKVYGLKNTIHQFFTDCGYEITGDKVVIPEKDYRFLVLTLIRYTNWSAYREKEDQLEASCEHLIRYVEERFFYRKYPYEERRLIHRGLQIAYARQKEHLVSYDPVEMLAAQKIPLYKLVEKGLKEIEPAVTFEENEIFYVFSLFNSRIYTSNNLEMLRKDFDVVYDYFVNKKPELLYLIARLEETLQVPLSDNLLFKKSFLQFVRTFWGDCQVFLPEKLFILNQEQEEVFTKVLAVFDHWRARYQIQVRWNYNLMRKFIASLTLVFYETKSDAIDLYIVAPTDIKYLFYREAVDKIADKRMKVSDMIYSTLDDLMEDIIFCNKRVILCDYTKYHETHFSASTTVYPISLSTTGEVLDQMMADLYQYDLAE